MDALIRSEDPLHPANHICSLCRGFYALGWVTGTGGGTSIRHGSHIYIAPSGVQKELMKPEDMFVLDYEKRVYVRTPPILKPSACTPLFLAAFDQGAGCCIHTHSQAAVMVTMLAEVMGKDTFEVERVEQIKGIPRGRAYPGEMLGYLDRLVVPIIDNTAHEEDLTSSLTEAMQQFPDTYAVLVRRHGVYVWGDNVHKAKTQAESYCNSIIQCLYFSKLFRENVLKYPSKTPSEAVINGFSGQERLHINNTSLPLDHPSLTYNKVMNRSALEPRPANEDTVDFKKKLAHARGPLITMDYDNALAYGMSESLFTGLKDIFEAICAHKSHGGVLSPSRFTLTLRRDNEMFRSAMHQDAHEFLNLLLNDVVESVEAHHGTQKSQSRWVHELFEGLLTSETKCLTCENTSQRDEVFLDLSLDLKEHSSVTACLRKFSQEEMLREKNKFHCDNCGGLQEAERRMKIKRLPRILALHLKRFKYTEDLQQLQKLFHRVVYPYHLRLFNTTDDAEDPDRLYELYAVVVHIGGGPYHGHYVAVIKTEDKGWLLFDDELVQPVDKNFVKNFFGDRPGLACAYILFFQEISPEAFRCQQASEAAVPVNASELHFDHEVNDDDSLKTKKELQKEEKERKMAVRKQIQEEVDAERVRRKVGDSRNERSSSTNRPTNDRPTKSNDRTTKSSSSSDWLKKSRSNSDRLKKSNSDGDRLKKTGSSSEDRPQNPTSHSESQLSSSLSGHLSRLTSNSRSFRKSKDSGRTSKPNETVELPLGEPEDGPVADSFRNRLTSLRKKTSMMLL